MTSRTTPHPAPAAPGATGTPAAAGAGPAAAPGRPRAGAPRRRRRSRLPYLLVLPALVVLLAALGYPIGWQLVTSFREYGLLQQFGAAPAWVGLDNYAALVTDPDLWAVVVRSVVFCVVTALVTVVVGGALGILMTAHGPVGAGRPPGRPCSSPGRCRSSPR